MKLSVWAFLGLSFLYLLASFVLSIFTSFGWTILFLFYALGIFFLAIFALQLLTSLVFYFKGVTSLWVSVSSLAILLVVQGMALLLSPGDCGDNPGGGAFILRVLFDRSVCDHATREFVSYISFGVLLIYVFVLIWWLGRVYWEAQKRSSSAVPKIFLKVLYTSVIVFWILLLSWYGLVSVGKDYAREISLLQVNGGDSVSHCQTISSKNPSLCEDLLTRYGYTFEKERHGYFIITDKDFSFARLFGKGILLLPRF